MDLLFKFELNDLKKIGGTKFKIRDFVSDAKQIYFITNTWGNDVYSLKDSKLVVSDAIEKHLIKKTEIVHQYRMFDSIPLFKRASKNLSSQL